MMHLACLREDDQRRHECRTRAAGGAMTRRLSGSGAVAATFVSSKE